MNGTFTRDPLFHRLLRLATLGLLAACIVAALASAQCSGSQCDECSMYNSCLRCCHQPPELWVINTRHLPRCSNLDAAFEHMSFKRYDRRRCCFVNETRESFLAQEGNKPTLFFSHGNTLKHKGAMKSCWSLYEKLCCCPGKKRLVFWSWPAQRVFKTERLRVREMIKKNLRIKYVYAEYQGYYQAKLVQQMSMSQRVMMSGHSYGAIQAAAAAHLLGGGRVRGLTLEGGAPVEIPNLRVGFISGAFDYDMMYPGHRYGQAFVAAEKVFSTVNCHDRTLKKWPKTSWHCRQAIGYVGMNPRMLGQYRHKLCQQNTYPENGTSHYMKPHLKNARFVNALCCLSFGNCKSCLKPSAAKVPSAADASDAAAEDVVQPEVTKSDKEPKVNRSKAKTAAKRSRRPTSSSQSSHSRSRVATHG